MQIHQNKLSGFINCKPVLITQSKHMVDQKSNGTSTNTGLQSWKNKWRRSLMCLHCFSNSIQTGFTTQLASKTSSGMYCKTRHMLLGNNAHTYARTPLKWGSQNYTLSGDSLRFLTGGHTNLAAGHINGKGWWPFPSYGSGHAPMANFKKYNLMICSSPLF